MSKPTARYKTGSTTEPTRTTGPNTRLSSNPTDRSPDDDPHSRPTDPKDARDFLETKGLLVPEGQTVNTNMAAACLYQIANISPGNTPRHVTTAIRSLALLLEDSVTDLATQSYHDGFQAELDNFTTKIRQLIEDAHEKIDTKIKSIPQSSTTNQPQHQSSNDHSSHTHLPGMTPTYSQMLTSTQPDVDPKMLAKYGIRRRQVMLDGIPKESELGQLSGKDLTAKINAALQAIQAGNGVRIRAATKQSRDGILIEMDSDIGAAWTKGDGNMTRLCKKLNDNATVRPRHYQLIALRAPLTAEPENKHFITEVLEANSLPTGTITAMRWAKPIYRRSPNQVTAHVILTVNDANEANRLLALGLYIANKKVEVQKCKTEPTRCLKCQGWNHYAKECTTNDDTCGKCAETGHRTKDCTSPLNRCVSCKTDDHASYDRNCPTLLRKQVEKDRNNPENTLPFIPTDAPWTWNKNSDKNSSQPERGTGPPPAIRYRPDTQRQRQEQTNSTQYDWDHSPLTPLASTDPATLYANWDPSSYTAPWDAQLPPPAPAPAPHIQEPTPGTK